MSNEAIHIYVTYRCTRGDWIERDGDEDSGSATEYESLPGGVLDRSRGIVVSCPTRLQSDWVVPDGLNLNLILRSNLLLCSGARLIVRGTASIVSVDNAVITHDGCSSGSGAISVENSGVLIVNGCVFADFHSDQGGALHISENSSVQMDSCGFSGCTACCGGAIYVSEDSEVKLAECRFDDCSAESKEGIRFSGSVLLNGSPNSDWRSFTSEAVCCFGSATFIDCTFGAAVVNGEMRQKKPAPRVKSSNRSVGEKPSLRIVSNMYQRLGLEEIGDDKFEVSKDIDEPVEYNDEDAIPDFLNIAHPGAILEPDVAFYSVEDSSDFSPKTSFLDYRGLMHLCLEGWMLPSVRDLVSIFPYEEKGHSVAFTTLIYSDHGLSKMEFIRNYKWVLLESMGEGEADRFVRLLNGVIDEFLVCSPCGFGRDFSEQSMEPVASRSFLCDVCGEEIEPGERIFARTEPVRAIRHLSCNSQVRFIREYAIVEYLAREIEYFEENLVATEDSDYILEGNLSHKVFPKAGFVYDRDGKIIRLPHFSEFVFRYVSGEEDYTLMREYRPYHMYLEFLFRLKGATTQQIQSMQGFKYLLREDSCDLRYTELRRLVFDVSYSDLFFDERVYKEVDRGFKTAVYEVLFRKLFAEMKILCGDYSIIRHGKEMSYAVESRDADLTISIDKTGVYCTDSSCSLTFKEFFEDCPCADPYLEYISKLEAST